MICESGSDLEENASLIPDDKTHDDKWTCAPPRFQVKILVTPTLLAGDYQQLTTCDIVFLMYIGQVNFLRMQRPEQLYVKVYSTVKRLLDSADSFFFFFFFLTMVVAAFRRFCNVTDKCSYLEACFQHGA